MLGRAVDLGGEVGACRRPTWRSTWTGKIRAALMLGRAVDLGGRGRSVSAADPGGPPGRHDPAALMLGRAVDLGGEVGACRRPTGVHLDGEDPAALMLGRAVDLGERGRGLLTVARPPAARTRLACDAIPRRQGGRRWALGWSPTLANSAGGALSNSTGAPVSGWRKPRRVAWRQRRRSGVPARAVPRVADDGWPIFAIWTRI